MSKVYIIGGYQEDEEMLGAIWGSFTDRSNAVMAGENIAKSYEASSFCLTTLDGDKIYGPTQEDSITREEIEL